MMTYIDMSKYPYGSIERKAEDLIKTHGQRGARNACASLIAKANNNVRRYTTGNDSKLEHYRTVLDNYLRIEAAVDDMVNE